MTMDAKREPLLVTLGVIVKTSFFETLYKKRTLSISIFLVIPIALVILWLVNVEDPKPLEDFSGLFQVLFLHILIPLVTLLLGVDLFNSEFKSKTISYMFMRPVPRWAIYVGKIVGLYLTQLLLILLSVAVTFIMMLSKGDNSGYLDDLGGFLFLSALATLVYTSFFVMLGIKFKRPMVIGLVVAFFYEKTISAFSTTIAKATMLFHLFSVGKEIIDVPPFSNLYYFEDAASALLTLVVFVGLFAFLSILMLNKKEVA